LPNFAEAVCLGKMTDRDAIGGSMIQGLGITVGRIHRQARLSEDQPGGKPGLA